MSVVPRLRVQFGNFFVVSVANSLRRVSEVQKGLKWRKGSPSEDREKVRIKTVPGRTVESMEDQNCIDTIKTIRFEAVCCALWDVSTLTSPL